MAKRRASARATIDAQRIGAASSVEYRRGGRLYRHNFGRGAHAHRAGAYLVIGPVKWTPDSFIK